MDILLKSIPVIESSRKTCSVLIPDHYTEEFEAARKYYGNVRKILSVFLGSYAGFVKNELSNPGSINRKYQSQGQHLKKINFRPVESDWLKLTVLADQKGWSVAYLFVVMLMYYIHDKESGDWVYAGVPTYITVYQKFTPPFFTSKVILRI